MSDAKQPSTSAPECAALTKSVVIGVRVTGDEADALRALAEQHHTTVPEYVRTCLRLADLMSEWSR